jgi:hypothetical protein
MYSTGEVCDVTIEVVAQQGHNTQQLQYVKLESSQQISKTAEKPLQKTCGIIFVCSVSFTLKMTHRHVIRYPFVIEAWKAVTTMC